MSKSSLKDIPRFSRNVAFPVIANLWFGSVYWGLTPQQQPGSYQGGEMIMMKSVIWWRKPEYPEETTDLRQVTDETFGVPQKAWGDFHLDLPVKLRETFITVTQVESQGESLNGQAGTWRYEA